MKFRSRALFIAFTVVCVVALIYQWIHISRVQRNAGPGALSGEKMRVDLRYVKRDCSCASWKIVEPAKMEGYVYIEPAGENLRISPTQVAKTDSGWLLRLNGQFYLEEGLPDVAQENRDPSAEKARVFQYTSAEVIKPE
jgi:hypothetical protein